MYVNILGPRLNSFIQEVTRIKEKLKAQAIRIAKLASYILLQFICMHLYSNFYALSFFLGIMFSDELKNRLFGRIHIITHAQYSNMEKFNYIMFLLVSIYLVTPLQGLFAASQGAYLGHKIYSIASERHA